MVCLRVVAFPVRLGYGKTTHGERLHKYMYPLGAVVSHKGGGIYDRGNARYVDFARVSVKKPVAGVGYTYIGS